MSTKPETIRYVLFSSSMFWSAGETLKQAAETLRKQGAKRTDQVVAYVVANDTKPGVDAYGALVYGGGDAPNAWAVPVGLIGKLGGLI